jgi:tRNA(Arg) A34 adenosine deaminase TadA
MTQVELMQRAIEISRTSLDRPGTQPFGAVVAKDGVIVGEGLNHAVANHDPTSHGETEAIRDACQRLGTTDLSGCELYTSCEPCSLCVSAMYLAGIERLYYAASLAESAELMSGKDARLVCLTEPVDLRREVGRAVGERSMPARQLLAEEALPVIRTWSERTLPNLG